MQKRAFGSCTHHHCCSAGGSRGGRGGGDDGDGDRGARRDARG